MDGRHQNSNECIRPNCSDGYSPNAITLGVAVARLKTSLAYKTLGISLSKIMIGIIAGIGVGYQFNLPYEAFAVLVIQMSMPVAVTSYLLAEKYGADSEAVAGLVVISTFLTTFITPVLLSFLLI